MLSFKFWVPETVASYKNLAKDYIAQLTFASSKSTIEASEKSVKYVQSYSLCPRQAFIEQDISDKK